jgi:hypothetical protein
MIATLLATARLQKRLSTRAGMTYDLMRLTRIPHEHPRDCRCERSHLTPLEIATIVIAVYPAS